MWRKKIKIKKRKKIGDGYFSSPNSETGWRRLIVTVLKFNFALRWFKKKQKHLKPTRLYKPLHSCVSLDGFGSFGLPTHTKALKSSCDRTGRVFGCFFISSGHALIFTFITISVFVDVEGLNGGGGVASYSQHTLYSQSTACWRWQQLW